MWVPSVDPIHPLNPADANSDSKRKLFIETAGMVTYLLYNSVLPNIKNVWKNTRMTSLKIVVASSISSKVQALP
jgi:hypothetical protein